MALSPPHIIVGSKMASRQPTALAITTPTVIATRRSVVGFVDAFAVFMESMTRL
ncbi:hypothetical protein SAJA_01565 [Salinisphaera japonica YTM-1]|uniref:Uncharacterized protein n=1 Tax=Salinisphaera japonica YTM-1 TaxID=1209778 RepID=A0A423Q1F3_9GAMM|nr:hypothetical protein SAJA_01565 [Salinisphaera japonica YTM-1]